MKTMKAMAKAVKGRATKKGMAAMKAKTAKKEKPAKPYVEPKVKKGHSMNKGQIGALIEHTSGVKKASCMKVLKALEEAVPKLLAKGTVTLPNIARLKMRTKKATKAGKRMMFGVEMMVKAKPARKVVKAFPVKALKDVKW